MSIYLNTAKLMSCLMVIGVAGVLALPARAQQTTQQANCAQNPHGCMQNGPSSDPSGNIQGADPYHYGDLDREPGASQVTPANPLNKPKSGN